MMTMDTVLILILTIVVLGVILNPSNWIRLAILVVGPKRKSKMLENLQKSISAEPDVQKRWLYQSIFKKATGKDKRAVRDALKIGRKPDGD